VVVRVPTRSNAIISALINLWEERGEEGGERREPLRRCIVALLMRVLMEAVDIVIAAGRTMAYERRAGPGPGPWCGRPASGRPPAPAWPVHLVDYRRVASCDSPSMTGIKTTSSRLAPGNLMELLSTRTNLDRFVTIVNFGSAYFRKWVLLLTRHTLM